MMDFDHDRTADRTIVLADGRILGYAVFGDPDGFPILNCHGGLMCRFDVEPAAGAARELGVCIVSPDRPGIATSDQRPDRDTLDWSSDVRELLDRLGIDRLACMGWSMGGQYALAVAHDLADRVLATAVIAGCPPLDHEATFAELNEMDRRLTRLSYEHPGRARFEFAWLGRLERQFPVRLAKVSSRTWGAADRATVVEHARWMGANIAAAATEPGGLVEEYLALVRPWRFELADVAGQVAVWQGTEDALVPPRWGERLAAGLREAELHTIDGAGHLIALTHRADVIRDLLVMTGVSGRSAG
jgi:pimeloyl-ACP methyl ester carboxylesterase